MNDPIITCCGLADIAERLIKRYETGEISREEYLRVCEDGMKKLPEWFREIAAQCLEEYGPRSVS